MPNLHGDHAANAVSAAPDPTTCHLCGAGALTTISGYAGLNRVTSDCKPWPAGGAIARCGACGLVQTPTTPDWAVEADTIYRQYAIYHQSGGHEQSVFGGGD